MTKGFPSTVTDDQHFLSDKQLISRIVESAALRSTDVVLEIGGGTGNISVEIMKRSGRLIIVEKDPELSVHLVNRFKGKSNVSVLPGNILDVDIPPFNKIVANPPYAVLQQFFVKLIKEGRQNFEQAVLVVPYAFEKKMTATPDSDYFGVISALFMAFYNVETIMQINKESFSPPPRVTSACVSVKPKDPATSQFSKTQKLLQRLFLYDEKKVRNVIMQSLWNEGDQIIGIRLTKREAGALADQILSGLSQQLAEKKVLELTNEEFRDLTITLLSWERETSNKSTSAN